MLQTMLNSNFSQAMDLFNEIDDLNDLFSLEKYPKADSVVEGFEVLQSKYSNLHENYEKEMENSKKVEKCLLKCLKFYSKLCKKYEIQQKLITNLEEKIKENISRLEEAQRNEERLKGLIEVYRAERGIYASQTSCQLRKDKAILLDVCCKLISEPFRDSNIRNIIHLLLRKFKKDLDNDKIVALLKIKNLKLKVESDSEDFENYKLDLTNLKNEFKSEEKLIETSKVKVKELKEEKNDPLDLSMSRMEVEETKGPPVVADVKETSGPLIAEVEKEKKNLCSSEEVPYMEDCSEEECESDVPQENFFYENRSCDLDSIESNKQLPTLKVMNEPCAIGISLGNAGSIFDIPDENSQKVPVAVEPEIFSGIIFESKDKSDVTKPSLDSLDSEEESTFPYEKELCKIFREMSSIRLLSPIREYCETRNCTADSGVNRSENEKSKRNLKRNSDSEELSCKSKQLKPEDEKKDSNLLDSILSAMSIQNEEFKSNVVARKESELKTKTEFKVSSPVKSYTRKRSQNVNSKPQSFGVRQSPRKIAEDEKKIEKLVSDEIKNFVSAVISSKEDADKKVRHCLSVLADKSEDVIAKCVVAMVLENIDEPVELFERPSPPLTKTQHRLIVLLSVFKTLDSNSEKISSKILSLIWEKLLPDNFFWPDDCVEAATRFYAALCRSRNDTKTLWRFCVHGLTEMRQRCPLMMFTVLRTWPDVLHDASTLKNNLLAVTIVNIFLHMPKKEGLRNFNQGRKLVALKHLLMNFYQFKIEDSIESYAGKVLDALCREEPGAEKAAVLLFTSRDQSWAIKNLVPLLKFKFTDWVDGKLEDSKASKILSALKQICPFFQKEGEKAKVKDVVCCLSEILTSATKSHESEVELIEVLLKLKHYPEARKVIREWVPKKPINDNLRNEIINVSAENILRELKLNRKREPKNASLRKKSKKWKKPKEKKKKKKTQKKKEQKVRMESTSLSS